MKFIKKPVAIEAIEWDGTNFSELQEWVGSDFGGIYDMTDSAPSLVIKTLEGKHLARMGDWIIKGVKGEFYPCKPDIFKQTYYTEKEYAELGL